MLSGKDRRLGLWAAPAAPMLQRAGKNSSSSRATVKGTLRVRCPNTSGKNQSAMTSGEEAAWYWPKLGHSSWRDFEGQVSVSSLQNSSLPKG